MLGLMSLDGTWQLRPVQEFAEALVQGEGDDGGWLTQDLPAHWQEHPALAGYSGRVVYRRRFSGGPAEGVRHFLRVNGVFYRYAAYLDQVLLGSHEGYFAPADFEVTGLLRGENLLTLAVECPDEPRKLGKRLITGVFSHWDHLDPQLNPGGVWLPVELYSTGAARLVRLGAQLVSFDASAAKVKVDLEVDLARAFPGEGRREPAQDPLIQVTFTPANFSGEPQSFKFRVRLEAGLSRLSHVCPLERYRLWWTHDLGEPNLYDVEARLFDRDGGLLDRLTIRTGLRTIALRNWIFYLNRERLFIKGENYPPPEARLARVTRDRVQGDLDLAVGAHLNMLRLHAHVDHPLLYDVADERGMLLWQDLPLQWLYAREALPEAERQAREMVRLLGHHPSVALWCMHNEPVYIEDTKDESLARALKTYYNAFIYSWNRDVMDRRLAKAARAEDPTRPVQRASGEIALFHRGGDTHWYFGWYMTHGPLRLFDQVRRLLPRNVRFVSEFGAQSFPHRESAVRFMDGDVRKLDWNHLAARHSAQPDVMRFWLDIDACPDLETLIALTQWYQMRLNQFYLDRLRFHKYRPCGGFLAFSFADPNPAVAWSLLDYWRVPKASYHHLANCCHPEYAFTLLDREWYRPGQTVRVPVYVVNDSPRSHAEATVQVRVTAPGGALLATAAFATRLPGDGHAAKAGEVTFAPAASGKHVVELALDYDGGSLRNRYEVFVAEQAPGRWGPEVLR
ncbi:MAG: glycoside hydrolase family 2 protein [Chitinophagales bacterium]